MANGIPAGFNSVTPSLIFKDTAKAIELYKKAFGAKEIDRLNYPNGKGIMHAVIEIGDSRFMLGDETPNMKAQPSASFYLYVPDADAAMKKAEEAGLKNIMTIEDMFWGDRLGCVVDEFGIQWSIATQTREVSKTEIEEGAKEMAKNMGMAS